MEINKKAPVKQSREIFIYAKPADVWKKLTDINKWSEWHPKIEKSAILGELKAGTSFKWVTNGSKIHSTLHTSNPNKSFGWTGKAMGIYAIHNWILEEQNGGTNLKTEESMEGLLAYLFKGKLNKIVIESMEEFLSYLKTEVERRNKA